MPTETATVVTLHRTYGTDFIVFTYNFIDTLHLARLVLGWVTVSVCN